MNTCVFPGCLSTGFDVQGVLGVSLALGTRREETEPTLFLTHQGCLRAFSQVYRSFGSFSSRWQIKSLAKGNIRGSAKDQIS